MSPAKPFRGIQGQELFMPTRRPSCDSVSFDQTKISKR